MISMQRSVTSIS